MDKFRCACGCLVDACDIIRVKTNLVDRSSRHNSCPEHPEYPEGRVLTKLFNCVDCGEEVEVDVHGSGRATRCSGCQAKFKLKNTRINRRLNKLKKAAAKKTQLLEPVGVAKKLKALETVKQAKKALILDHPDNTFKCLNFGLCGLCIKPYFECKMFKTEENNDGKN